MQTFSISFISNSDLKCNINKFVSFCILEYNILLTVVYVLRWLDSQVKHYSLVHTITSYEHLRLAYQPSTMKKKKIQQRLFVCRYPLAIYIYIQQREERIIERKKKEEKKNVYHPLVHRLLTTLSFFHIRSK